MLSRGAVIQNQLGVLSTCAWKSVLSPVLFFQPVHVYQGKSACKPTINQFNDAASQSLPLPLLFHVDFQRCCRRAILVWLGPRVMWRNTEMTGFRAFCYLSWKRRSLSLSLNRETTVGKPGTTQSNPTTTFWAAICLFWIAFAVSFRQKDFIQQ